MYYSSRVSEDVNNYSICVLENGEIRPMKNYGDIDMNLVYVNTIPIDGEELIVVVSGKYARYKPVVVIEKFNSMSNL